MALLKSRFYQAILALFLFSLTWFSASPAWAVDRAALYIQTEGSNLVRPNSSPRLKIGAVICEAQTAGASSALFVKADFVTTNRQTDGVPRTATGLTFNPDEPAYMFISHQGLVSSVFAQNGGTATHQTIEAIVPARGVPPFALTVEGALGVRSLGYEPYTDIIGKRDIKLVCGSRGKSYLSPALQPFLKKGLDDLYNGTIIAFKGAAGLAAGLAAGIGALFAFIFGALGNSLQQLY